jgi:fumarate hydratase class I
MIMIKITLPVTAEEIRKLKIGDELSITGTMITGRDAAHKYMVEQDAFEVKELLNNGMIYHCGPVVKKVGDEWFFVAAGPTTSAREEVYEYDVFKRYNVRAVIGKGGMGKRTLEGCKEFGCVYLHAIGGMGTALAKSVKKVKAVYRLEEFGAPEAMWVIDVVDFPVVVTMDSHGNSIHEKVQQESEARARQLMGL